MSRPPMKLAFAALLSSGAISLLSTTPSWAQSFSASTTLNPFDGNSGTTPASNQVLDLSLSEALQRGFARNLGLFVSHVGVEQAHAQRLRALSSLLPQLTGNVLDTYQRLNLRTLGIEFPGVPATVRFNLFDARASVTQSVFDLHAIDNYRSADQGARAAELSQRDAREIVILVVGANYLLTISGESRVQSADVQLKTAEALYQLARDQEAAGVAAHIDTLRAHVEVQSRRQALIEAQNTLDKQRIALARTIGLPLTQPVRLVNRVPYRPLPDLELGRAMERAMHERADYQSALAQLRAAELAKRAAAEQHLPALVFHGDFGAIGRDLNTLIPTYTATGVLRVSLFEGGRIQADVRQADAALQQRRAEVENLRTKIEQDVTSAILDLRSAAQRVETARAGLDLANQALREAQDRFADGVTNNIEVIQAQQSVATANDQFINSVYSHNIGKVLLARTTGNAEQMIERYLDEH